LPDFDLVGLPDLECDLSCLDVQLEPLPQIELEPLPVIELAELPQIEVDVGPLLDLVG
jgi:hypothetical protein